MYRQQPPPQPGMMSQPNGLYGGQQNPGQFGADPFCKLVYLTFDIKPLKLI
jgi:hypothetical protein